MAIYDEQGELKGYRFVTEPDEPPKPHLYDVGTHIIFTKILSVVTPIAVSVA